MGAIKRPGKRERKARLRAKLGAVNRHYSRFATLDNVGKADPLDGCLTFSRSGKLVPARLVLEGTGSGILEHEGLKSKSHYTGCAAARLTNFDRPTHDTIPKYGRKGQLIKLQAGVTSRQGAIISLHNSPKGSKASTANNRNNKRAYGLKERFSRAESGKVYTDSTKHLKPEGKPNQDCLRNVVEKVIPSHVVPLTDKLTGEKKLVRVPARIVLTGIVVGSK